MYCPTLPHPCSTWRETPAIPYVSCSRCRPPRRSITLRRERRGTVAAGDGKRGQLRPRRLTDSLSRSLVARFSPGIASYGDWFALVNVKHYYKTNAIVFRERAFLRACWLRCASLEADTALARHLRATPAWCWAGTGAGLTIEDGIHPLLAAPTGLSIALKEKGAFISGPNGAGKSTFLRMVGLNLVLARARALLAAAAGPHPGVCLVDEIFRGTNHVESVAAAAAVLDTLAARSMVLVSSHNLELASLLEHRLAPHCLRRDAHGQLALAPGVLDRTNGIALLGEQGFGVEIEQKAQKVATWLTGYLGRPEAGAHVLVEACVRT